MNKLTTVTGVAIYAMLFSVIPASESNASGYWNWDCQRSSVVSFWEENIAGNELTGRGTLCTTDNGMWSTLKVRGMTPGNAYTVWWVYVDDPESCANFPLPVPDAIPFPEPADYAGPCGLADFFTPDESGEFLNPLAVYGRMDSGVARHARRTRFAGDLRSFKPSHGSQVWMFVFGHGPADDTDNRQLARQLLTPEDPLSGVPHLGIEGRPFGYPAGVVVFNIP
jgi:hypothetical protein